MRPLLATDLLNTTSDDGFGGMVDLSLDLPGDHTFWIICMSGLSIRQYVH